MLALLLSAGPHRCALPCRRVREVISRVKLEPLAGAPRHLAGVFSYRGVITPVADLCWLVAGSPCSSRLSSRIVLLDHSLAAGRKRPVGLLAERVTETRELRAEHGARAELPYLGHVVVDGDEMISLLDADELLQRAFAVLPTIGGGEDSRLHGAPEHQQ